jgi:hypothetical protein
VKLGLPGAGLLAVALVAALAVPWHLLSDTKQNDAVVSAAANSVSGTSFVPAIASIRVTTPPTAAGTSFSAAAATKVKGGCAPSPHRCGFPDATNTGVPGTVKLRKVPAQVSKGKGWAYDPRGWVEVYGNGAVLSGLYIPYNLDISASNVTIKNVKVVENGDGFGISLRHTRNVIIEHSDVFSPYASGPNRLQVAIKDVYGDSRGTTVEYDNIWHSATAVQLSEGRIVNNYIHDLSYASGDHVNGITSDAGDRAGLTIEHNTVFNPKGQTDAIGLFEDFGQQFDCLIENNLIAGGGYTLYGGANPGGQKPANIVIIGNRFGRIYYHKGGYYGPATAVASSGSGDVWRGNIWDDTGKPVSLL